ncbi:MAG TPA: ribosome maturation factor RimM [Hyphomicrobium sp.]|nr:ribosome maturation factor RimM [Hyphomicrobium sp.]
MTTNDKKDRVLLGEITGVHGIRGDLLVRSYTQAPEAIASYGPLADASGARHFSLKVVRSTDKGIVARIEGIADRTAAEKLRGTKLFVDRARLPETEAAEFYHADLIGLKAVSEDGAHLGEIVSVQNFGAGDLLELKPVSGAATEFIPFEDQWVPRVDLKSGLVVINQPVTVEAEPGEDSDA